MSDRSNVFYSPTGNIEVWETKPDGYFTEEEWKELHPPVEPDPPTPEEARTSKLIEINDAYTASVSVAKVGVPEDEISTWDIQRLEALAWEEYPDIATPFLEGLLLKRNESRELYGLPLLTLDELRTKCLEKVKAYEELTRTMTGKRQGLEDAIYAATTVEQIQSITWDTIVEEPVN